MTTTASKAVAERRAQLADNQNAIARMVQRMVPEIQRALPRHLEADRVARIAITVLRRDEALSGCSPESFVGSLLTAAALGLEVGVNGEAYLVAYGPECTLIVGYQGYAKLFWQHPMAKHLDAQAVYEHDEFDYAYGLNPYLNHKPAKTDRGKIVNYYAVGALSTGASAFVVLTPDEVKALRSGKVGPSGNIPDPMRWMERKTAVRQLIKLLPKSPNLVRALEVDEVGGHKLLADQVAANELLASAEPRALEAGPTADDIAAMNAEAHAEAADR